MSASTATTGLPLWPPWPTNGATIQSPPPVPAGTYPITGIQQDIGADGSTPLRQEIDAWAADFSNFTQLSLFLLALSYFEALDTNDKLGYFQIAGIHGQPLVPWDEQTESESPGFGYCTHGSILFPCWHRPYVLLVEQRLYEIMIQVVIPYFPPEEQGDLIEQAKAWRLPYWDWAAKKNNSQNPQEPVNYNVPWIVRLETIPVLTPAGVWPITNPLYTFRTPEPMGKYGITASGGAPFDLAKATSRCPLPDTPRTHDEWVNGYQDNDQVVINLRATQWYESSSKHQYTDSLGEAVYRLFSQNYFSSYDAFATTAYTRTLKNPPDYLSCEDIHNNIHNWVGGAGLGNNDGGHMCDIAVAAFDPIFWLHHCNIDRQFAIWQTLNDKSWFDDSDEQLPDRDGNWSTPPGTVVTPQTPLAPFHYDANGSTYNSDLIRGWIKLGYSYPELQPWLIGTKYDNKAQYLEDVRKQVKNLYADPVSNGELYKLPSNKSSQDIPDYIVNVRYERFALGGQSFTIHFFLEGHKVGQIYNFVASSRAVGGPEGCANCQSQESRKALSKGQIHLTSHLFRRFAAEDKKQKSSFPTYYHSPDVVEAYLTEHLSWKISVTRGVQVGPEAIGGLRVSVARGAATHYKGGSKLAQYGGYQILHDITHGKPGGHLRDDNEL
ncbi:Di-copper centre-containing protein [Sistotremastrum suecicum HHB10207 ss-3]|uniref:tyrosinase n=1 Tax=Sistotremastrum suecicum HHB10207 ss-3 TaxID=1314776 RepID=A0A166EDE1_9AGAM|nr:Di-copper centre-containing protein [Sistotremastrum suecicum HHB10207 ss-3]